MCRARRVGAARDDHRGESQELRALAVELRPKALDDFGLGAAIERLAETYRAATGMPSTCSRGGRPAARRGRDGALPHRPGEPDERRQARRAARPASRPPPGAAVIAVVEDDGAGFDPRRDRRPGSDVDAGARASSCQVRSGRVTSRRGTTIAVEVPL